MSSPHPTRTRLRTLRNRAGDRIRTARIHLAARLLPADVPASLFTAPPAATLDPESARWLAAHHTPAPPTPVPASTALVYADQPVQEWMGETLTLLGWTVTEPVFVLEGWVPARGEALPTGQPATTYTTPTKTFARKTDPATSKKAGAAAAANQSITVNSHQGQLLFAYHHQHATNPGTGYTAAEAVNAAGLLTDGMHGSPWHRVTDLRDLGLLTFLLDGTGQRTTRKNQSNTDGQVLVITPLGLRAATALAALADHGYPDYPLTFNGPTEPALFEELPATLARIDTMPPPAENTDT